VNPKTSPKCNVAQEKRYLMSKAYAKDRQNERPPISLVSFSFFQVGMVCKVWMGIFLFTVGHF
jgi:hypothetical protein